MAGNLTALCCGNNIPNGRDIVAGLKVVSPPPRIIFIAEGFQGDEILRYCGEREIFRRVVRSAIDIAKEICKYPCDTAYVGPETSEDIGRAFGKSNLRLSFVYL